MPNESNINEGKKKLFIYIALAVVTFSVYWQVHGYDFINYDDPAYITENNHVQSGTTSNGVFWAFGTKYFGLWNPLVWISFIFDYQLYGLNAGGYHITNLILHILSTLLLFWLFHRMTHEIWKSSFVAAFFALHPLHVESVAWVSERKDVLSAFFWMLTLCCYVHYTEKPIIKRYLLVLFSFILALMSKPMVITLPLIMILLDYWPLNRFQSQKSNLFLWQLKEKWPFFILSLILVFITFYTPGDNVSYEFLPLATRLANAPVAFVTYLVKTFWPQDMAVFYPFPVSIPSWKVIGALILIFLITLAGIITVKRQPYLFVGWLWFMITIALVIGIRQIGDFSMADRYHYLPSIGLGMMLAWGMPLLFPKETLRHKILFPASMIFLMILSLLTWQQCGHWKNSISVFSHALDATKNNYLAHNNLGLALFSKGKTDEVITHYNNVIRLRPLDVVPLQNKAIVYAKLGQYQLAIESYNEVIRLKPDYADAYHSRAIIYYGLGQYPKALEDFHKAIRLKPDHAEAYNNRANVYLQLRQHQKAIEDMNQAVSLKPDDAAIFYNRGNFYINLARHQQAIEDYTKAVSLKPAYAEAYNNRAFAYLNLGQYQQAIEDYNKAILLKPNYADAYNNRAFVYLTTGNTEAGCLDAKKACAMGTCSTLQLAGQKGLCR